MAKTGQLIHRSIPEKGDTMHVVVPGERFKAGRLQRWIYGSNYRQIWMTPIEVPVLDLDAVGGGLSPMRTGGFGQSVSLHFMGKDGRRYTVRSLDKDPSKRLMEELKDTVVEDVIQDLMSALLPIGGAGGGCADGSDGNPACAAPAGGDPRRSAVGSVSPRVCRADRHLAGTSVRSG